MKAKDEIENIINLFYSIISGKTNQKRNGKLFRTLFLPNARLLPTRYNRDEILTEYFNVEQQINRLESFLLDNDFYEYRENYKIDIVNNLANSYTEYKAKKMLMIMK